MCVHAREGNITGHGREFSRQTGFRSSAGQLHASPEPGVWHVAGCKEARIIAQLPDLRLSFEAAAVYLIRADSDDPKDWRELAGFPIEG